MKITLMWQDDTFMPYTSSDSEYCRGLEQNSVFVVDVKKQRNPQFHRMAFAFFHELHDMIPGDMGFEEFRRLLTVKAGYYNTVGNANGSVMVVPDSLSWASMEEAAFKDCWNAMISAFVLKYGNEISYDDLCRAAAA